MATSTIKNIDAMLGSETLPSANKTNCSGTVYIRHFGPLVMIEFNTSVTCTTGGSGWTTLFTLPSDYTPIAKQKFALIDDSTSSSSTGIAGTVEAQVTTDGEFQVWVPITEHKYWGGVMLYVRS